MATKLHNPEIQDDGVWMTASSFTIFTMTAGFGLLESGRVSPKDEVNVMVKNVVDVIFGGLAYWMFGYGFTFGDRFANPYIGVGDYFFDPERDDKPNADRVHLVGGISGLVATLYLKPRRYRFASKRARQMSDPTKAILGFLMIWWGWLAFNTASNYSVSRHQWTEGSRSAVGTIMASAGGGIMTVFISRCTTNKIQVDMLIDGMLASLVSSTAGCLFYTPWQASLVGAIGSAMALVIYPLLEKAEIDDPVGVVPVHVVGSIWGMISPAIFVCRDFGLDQDVTNDNDFSGLLYGGGLTLLLYQLAALTAITFFSGFCAFAILYLLQHSPIGLRLSRLDEELGADLREHGLAGVNIMTYTIEKKLTAESLSAVLMVIVRWRTKAKLGTLRRQRIADIQTTETQRGIEMTVQKRRTTENSAQSARR
ncbi:unnamed protein product [Cylicocyclus nassatus]|uniref:Ammonium transporter AmtB-like domain-containing protein n=1 Tax=Cylicocyclus nassatus TaxID=53992 RepID=A0AA36H395_CYLNA|nr:unnamed protein product [Cylicocyclus nassatus]